MDTRLQKPNATTIGSGKRIFFLHKPNIDVDESPWDQDNVTENS